jgi:hypothetical protein
MKRLLLALLTMMMLSAQAFAENAKDQEASGSSLPTMSLMMCKECPPPAAAQPAAMNQGDQRAAMTPMSSGSCSMCDAFGTMVDVMKMQQKLIASGPGAKKKKEVAGIDRKIAELEAMLAKMKNSPMACMTGMGPMQGGMQGMPCMTGQPCPVNGKPCPNMPQPPAK